MDVLSQLENGADAAAKLGNFVTEYRAWIERQRREAPNRPTRRREIADELLNRAGTAASRIEAGIESLGDPQVLEAFCFANRAMAMAGRQRLGIMQAKDLGSITPNGDHSNLLFC
jgi:hypothetical protein